MKNLTNEQLCSRIKDGNEEAKEWSIKNNYDFVTEKAKEALRGKHRWGVELDDLTQEGALALYGAVEKYDPASGNTFMAYAGTAISALPVRIRRRREHTRIEAGEHFHFTQSRVKKEEDNALSAIRHELCVVIPEKRYAAAEDWLTRILVCENELHAVELRLKQQRKMGKKVKWAGYDYLADYDGTWGEIRFDIAKGAAEIVSLADGDTVKTNKFALRAVAPRFEQTDTLPEKITLTFMESNCIWKQQSMIGSSFVKNFPFGRRHIWNA